MLKTNFDVQTAIAKTEQYCLQQIKLSFPMIEINTLFNIDTDEDGDLIGLISEKNGLVYQFVIRKEDPNPLLQRVVKDKEREEDVSSKK
jgi:hypothetical protein